MGKTSSATATKWGSSISVTRNSNGSYTVSSWGKRVNAANASSARQAISSMANSSGWRWWWSVSSSWGSGWSSGWSTGSSYRWAGWTWLTGTDWWTKYADNADIQSAITKYWKDKVYDALDYISGWGKSNSQISYLLTWNPNSKTSLWWSSTTTNPNTTGNESGIGATRKVNWMDYTSSSVDSFLKAKDYYKSQWMSDADAHTKAARLLESPTVSTSKEEKDAEQYGGYTDDTDMNEQTINDVTDDDWYDVKEDPAYQELLWMYNDLSDSFDSYRDTMDRLTSNNTESNVIDNKAEVSKDPIFDYNTYFKNDIVGDTKNVWETGEVKPETPTPNTPLTDVTKYQDDAISALQNLWFLEPNTEAAESMPGAEEQTAPEALAEDTPEALVQWFDEKMDELGQMWWEQWLTPQAVAQTYVDYKNRLAKYIKNNNIPDDQAAAMFDQLKNNEKLRNFLQANRR